MPEKENPENFDSKEFGAVVNLDKDLDSGLPIIRCIHGFVIFVPGAVGSNMFYSNTFSLFHLIRKVNQRKQITTQTTMVTFSTVAAAPKWLKICNKFSRHFRE